MTKQKFLYNLSRASYEKTWGKDYQKPSSMDKFLALLYRILPKIGPLKILTFRAPTPETEKLFESSFNVTLDRYRVLLTDLGRGKVTLANENFDVGEITARGKYRLNDETYAQLLDKLAEKHFADASPTLRAELLLFFTSPDARPSTKTREMARVKLQQDVEKLKNAPVTPVVAEGERNRIDSH